ncbi:unnamed protein product [Caenorhabditis auriculariae]|uniref:EGF-like domain-containing protein n=1 Tax=Caenorhabditis auriculariae TaxID=2777116 RepID=A0A8S1GXJ8_9PELO|nr:unnamed protein product [Caenorhabditis auriculariae]
MHLDSRLIPWLLLISGSVVGSRRNCSKEEFRCFVGGDCVSIKKWQDGIDDCPDASDEACLPWQFDCQFGSPRCVASKKLKDGKIDCYSGFDEGCPPHYFVCKDRSKCIEPWRFLDGKKDCADGSDEPCPQSQFPCADGSKCIEGKRFQDGREDCADHSDEECTGAQFSCSCGAVRCVSREAVGDGSWDCEDGSDELFNDTHAENSKCKDGKPRRSGTHTLSLGKLQLCPATVVNPCKPELGQICILVGGTWRCVCKLGTVRPLGSAKCVPVELLERYMRNPVTNCSELSDQLKEQFGALKDLEISRIQSAKFKPNSEIRRSPQKILFSGTTAMSRGDGFLHSGGEDIPFMFAVETTSISAHTIDTYALESDEDLSDTFTNKPLRDENGCNPSDRSTCAAKHQSCQKQADGAFRCACEANTVFADGECKVLRDECAEKSNDCDPTALCMDSPLSYECLCREGFLDISLEPRSRPGRKCLKLVNECAHGTLNNCSPNAKCLDKPAGFTCRKIESTNFVEGAKTDLSTFRRKALVHLEEIVQEVSFVAFFKPSPTVNECSQGSHDCDKMASCHDLPVGYNCKCPFGFTDVSPDQTKPGRTCAQVSLDCAGCNSTRAHCVSTKGGSLVCACLPGYVDMSPITPGQNCQPLKGRLQNGPEINFSFSIFVLMLSIDPSTAIGLRNDGAEGGEGRTDVSSQVPPGHASISTFELSL